MSAKQDTGIDVYQDVTDRIIEALEGGIVPWRRPWIAGADSMHNPASGTIYRGANPLLLQLRAMQDGYTDPRWITFKQARGYGGAPRKGEKATRVVFWKMLRGIDKDTGEEKTIPMLRHYAVFNVEQCDGLDLPPIEAGPGFDPIQAGEAIINGMPQAPPISYGGGRACYIPSTDEVKLPQRETFTSADGFYSTAFHELGHSTGHTSRLNRPEIGSSKFGSDPYAREELVAELTAAMLCGIAGIDPSGGQLDQSVSYIAGWLSALRNDRKLVVSAAGKAQHAADFILGRKPDEERPKAPVAPKPAEAPVSAAMSLF